MASSGYLVNAYNCNMTPAKTNLRGNLNIVYIFVVGDETAGKTRLIRAFTNARINDAFLPSFDYVSTYTHQLMSGPLELRIVELQSKRDLSL
ncbi:hypothetical protein CEXT_145931 [Caerostris extrusa]|uniref:Uncharacterized protein n=1 Tax=Caerostris extrusa TaxID=172846 RepID=A0AAV4VHE4_CAEEX|nr:hypothetical protein CEXT_145931 [Caerostris extrusa]